MKKRTIPMYVLVCSMGFAGVLGSAVSVCSYEETPEAYQYGEDMPLEIPEDKMGFREGMTGGPAQEEQFGDQGYDSAYEDWETEIYSEGGSEEYPQEEEWIRNTEKTHLVEDFEIAGKDEAEAVFNLLSYEELPLYMYLDVPELLQSPELPTGCESVALTMALQYEGIELAKTTIAREFLIYNRETDNTALGYVGDPFSDSGAGCFAPVIAATATDFFEDQGLDYTAYDITDSTIDELLAYVAANTPVVLWTTMYMAEPEFTGEDGEYNGRMYRWYRQEHCVVLSGYDLEGGTLQINDPLEGIVTRDKEEFERIYNLTGCNAVVLKKNVTKE